MEKIGYKYGKRRIEADVVYSNRKTLDLRVFPEGNVVVTAPLNTPIDIILEKIKPKSKWIVEQQRTFELYRPFSTERLYVPGETHRYLGRQYKLVINRKDRGHTEINLSKGMFTIHTKKEDVSTIIQNYYKQKATQVFKELLEKLLLEFPLFQSYDIRMTHRFMKKRWGSCAMDGTIILNTELIKANKTCIEYVILHELCHLIHPNHSKDFYMLLESLMPSWIKVKNKLECTLA